MLQNFSLLKSGVDVSPLLDALERKPYLWEQITARQTTPGSPHKYTEAIFLRWSAEQSIHACFNDTKAVDYPALSELPEALPLINEVLSLAESHELGRVLIVKLEPSGVITPHSDEGLVADSFERFHVSLQSDEGNIFCSKVSHSEFENVHMKVGEIYNFNHKRVHYLANASFKTRLHLIVDCVSPKFRKERDALSA